MQYYYEIEEAWKLYVKEGVVKAESLNLSLLKIWENSKMRGANYDKTLLQLGPNNDFKPLISLDKKLESYINQQKLSLYLVNEDYYVEDSCGVYLENISLSIGCNLNIKDTGYLAIHLAHQTAEIATLSYSENYIRALHDYETLSFPLTIEGKTYYTYILNKYSSLSEEEIRALMHQFSTFKKRYEERSQKNYYEKEDYISLFELSPEGRVLTRLTNTYLNKYFDSYTRLEDQFYNIDLASILSGKKQILVSRTEKHKKFLLSPIQWKSDNRILCQAEELEFSYRAYFEVENNYEVEQFSSTYPLNLQKRIASLLKSDYPCFVIYSDYKHLAYITSTIMEFTKKKALNLNYENSCDYVVRLCDLKMAEKLAYIHDYTDIIYNIYMKERNIVENKPLLHSLGSAFRGRKIPYKLIFYVEYNVFELLKQALTLNRNLIELQTIDLRTSAIMEVLAYQFGLKDGLKNRDVLKEFNNPESGKKLNSAICPEKVEVGPRKEKEVSYKIKDLEKQGIIDALIASNYNISKASRVLGISRASLYRKMKVYEIELDSKISVLK